MLEVLVSNFDQVQVMKTAKTCAKIHARRHSVISSLIYDFLELKT